MDCYTFIRENGRRFYMDDYESTVEDMLEDIALKCKRPRHRNKRMTHVDYKNIIKLMKREK